MYSFGKDSPITEHRTYAFYKKTGVLKIEKQP